MKYALILVAALSSPVFSAEFLDADSGTFYSGNSLHERAQSIDVEDRLHFLGYVVGVATELNRNSLICIPQRATAGQLRDVVKKALENRPDMRHMNGHHLTVASLSVGFPCPVKKNSGTGL